MFLTCTLRVKALHQQHCDVILSLHLPPGHAFLTLIPVDFCPALLSCSRFTCLKIKARSFPAWPSSAMPQNNTQLLQLRRSPAHRGAVTGRDSSHGKHQSIAGIAPETTWRVPGKQPALHLNIYSCSAVSTNYCILFRHFSPYVNSLASSCRRQHGNGDGEMLGKAGPDSPLTVGLKNKREGNPPPFGAGTAKS